MRIAFPLIGGKDWTGGRNYLFNLIRTLLNNCNQVIKPVLYYGEDINPDEIDTFSNLKGIELVCTSAFNRDRRFFSSLKAVVFGADRRIKSLFLEHHIDVVFETAQFFGTRLDIPTIAWLPDFQHRHLPQLFSPISRIKRDLGFSAQIASGRMIMLSSKDACLDCERFYPRSKGRTNAVNFAVPPPKLLDWGSARKIANSYGLPDEFVYLPNQFWMHKNHILVSEALAMIRKKGINIVIAASGNTRDPRNPNYYNQLCHKISSLGLKDDFLLLGLIPYDHLSALMQASIAVLNPSLFEGWSTTVEEARSLGVPLILSDLSVHREQAGESAIYFERNSADSLAKALSSISKLTVYERNSLMNKAAIDAQIRLVEFSKQFVALANRCYEENA